MAPSGPRRSRTTTSGAPPARSRRTVTSPAPASTHGRSRATVVDARSSRPRRLARTRSSRSRYRPSVTTIAASRFRASRNAAPMAIGADARAAAGVHEEPAAVAAARVARPHLFHVARDPGGRLGADRHEPLRAPLARADDVASLEVEVFQLEVEALRGAHPRGIEELEDRAVAQ